MDTLLNALSSDLQTRLNMIIQTNPLFWEQRLYRHFTNHGPAHSEQIQRKLLQLAQELPQDCRLTPDEVFIVSAAARLYEIGMQSPNLRPTLDFDYQPGDALSFSQLEEIRKNKHLLTERLILDSVCRDYHGQPLPLGLAPQSDEYIGCIAEVCRWCSDEPLEDVPEKLPVHGMVVRVRLLVALLRLADQLYIDRSRVNLDLLQRANLPEGQFARWWAYHYTQTLPIEKNQIRFFYFLPVTQQEYVGHIRDLIEPDFAYDNNPIIRYLWNEHDLHLMLHKMPVVRYDQPGGFQREMPHQLVVYLQGKRIHGDTRTEGFKLKTKAHIFLSYAREDGRKVEGLYQRLSDAGFKPWMDTKDILPGENWKLAIQRAIRRSDFFLVCLSANSVDKRGWIQREIKQALDIWQEKLDSDIYLIPVRLEDCKVPDRLRDFQWVNLFKRDGWTRLVKALQVGAERRAEVSANEGPSSGVEMATPRKGPKIVGSMQKTMSHDIGGITIKILFLAANPSDTARLRLGEESRAIDQVLRQAEFRDKFDIKQQWAVRVMDLQGYLLRHKPDIVHFSGHGSKSSEIILEDNSGNSQTVSARALSALFSVLKDNIRCVVLNACYSEPQAQAISEHIDCVVGMSESIGDAAAISFTSAFYQALGFGRDIKTAFDLGCVQIDLECLEEQDLPKLLCKKCDPKDIVFVQGD